MVLFFFFFNICDSSFFFVGGKKASRSREPRRTLGFVKLTGGRVSAKVRKNDKNIEGREAFCAYTFGTGGTERGGYCIK